MLVIPLGLEVIWKVHADWSHRPKNTRKWLCWEGCAARRQSSFPMPSTSSESKATYVWNRGNSNLQGWIGDDAYKTSLLGEKEEAQREDFMGLNIGAFPFSTTEQLSFLPSSSKVRIAKQFFSSNMQKQYIFASSCLHVWVGLVRYIFIRLFVTFKTSTFVYVYK